MHRSSQLQFKLMTPEAQSAAIQRLALHGTHLDTICERTGLSMAEVRRCLAGLQLERDPWQMRGPRWSAPRGLENAVRSSTWADGSGA